MMVIPDNLPASLAPLAWMLGSWKGWGMYSAQFLTDTSAPAQTSPRAQAGEAEHANEENDPEASDDQPVIEEIRCDIVGDYMRMTTTIRYAQVREGMSIDPVWDAHTALSLMDESDILWEETSYIHLLPGQVDVTTLAPGQYAPRELMGTSATTTGLGTLWAGVSVGPRVQLVSDAIARAPQADDITHLGRMYGLVNGEMMWTQECTRAGAEVAVELSGRLMRISEEPEEAYAAPATSGTEHTNTAGFSTSPTLER
ncbi:FABP family protein [Schaalia sp. lx-260]|uniref:FABP family protein n=1 Tax=Schaalia sp. lx-260 TaxID=2899082 RepID=UPI001E512C65|nr:heme-binding beta-barrel domain-containing protein [Schaalia sp. lx-260]MCD4549950.1 FABP family protein [Schaalia sp. lx-260]